MSETENHHHGKNEIIIVKRHSGGDHDTHHGGSWKIAYADFMTAMMAFFLVMWLVNAANEETKASVASYFNPIKLADEKPTAKGLKKPVDDADGEETRERSKQKAEEETQGAAAADGNDQTSSSGDQTNYSEADYFENPYSVLAEIAQEVGQQANVSAKGEGGASDSGPATGADGGQAYRDPFDPDFWTKQIEVTSAEKKNEATAAEKTETPAEGEIAALAKSAGTSSEDSTGTQDAQAANAATNAGTAEQKPEQAEQQTKTQDAAQQDAAKKLQDEIIQKIGGAAGKLAESLVVTPSEGGLLVSISDQGDDPMFNVGSAVPRKEMVLAMEQIGKILASRSGVILIRGHTDGRQFKGSLNENWRLSMDRAQSAYYMLVHGGLDEKRISQVSGFADRRLKMPEDPFNPANRRIEILIQADQG
ncbi:MotB family protein [Rhizobium sp. BK251]|uniref:MotB family protein n=1 Tax=Rhizobium sp. BK251 TaxID=2512125 RepID=UPI00104514F3|nr:MotB family protein [Rhizobium sp. BK251]TCL75635.1 chemotaxis protein MotB [Rhizobium sp. BK251]